MSYERFGGDALEYYPCRYGGGKTVFRGPRKRLDKPFVAFVGGAEFYGRFVEHPVSDLVEDSTDLHTVNFGIVNGGIDAFIHDRALMKTVNLAQVKVVQVFPAHTLSNRFYKVHPRRNDRFLQPTELLQTLYQELDFSDFHFVRHLLTSLRRVSPEKFRLVIEELQTAWTARMRLFMSQLSGQKILFHVHDRTSRVSDPELGPEPIFITDDMVADVGKAVDEIVTYDATETRLDTGTRGMIFDPMEEQMAAALFPPACHDGMCEALIPAIQKLT